MLSARSPQLEHMLDKDENSFDEVTDKDLTGSTKEQTREQIEISCKMHYLLANLTKDADLR